MRGPGSEMMYIVPSSSATHDFMTGLGGNNQSSENIEEGSWIDSARKAVIAVLKLLMNYFSVS
jgi:hypothetical protein